jgi:hypothetical protein
MPFAPLGYYLFLFASFFSAAFSLPRVLNAGHYSRKNGPGSWEEINSAEELITAYPARIQALFSAINLNHPGVEDALHSLQSGDTVAACHALPEHYRNISGRHWLNQGKDEKAEVPTMGVARQLTRDTVMFAGVTAGVPNMNDGGWNWTYTGPGNDQEFAYSLNGHRYFLTLLSEWKLTGQNMYVKKFDRLIRDWIIHNPLPPEGDLIYLVFKTPDNKPDWGDIGEVRCRDLETGIRLGESWPQAFYGFQKSESFTPAARLLMLASISEQAEYIRKYHKKGHNWTTMEMNALALAGLAFPEFRQAEAWTRYALDVMNKEIFQQVYPDGVQKELSTKIEWLALSTFELLDDNFRKAGREVPDKYIQRMEEMYNYLAYSMRPDGHQPLNNDSDREDLRPRVLKAVETFDRPDWKWIATNGKKGTVPTGLPSVVFSWAGIHIMRNGWDAGAPWAFFDTGPFGTGHQHADALHLSISPCGRDLLVDGGRYTHENYWSFDPRVWRGYFRSSFSHNVILVDGHGQKGGPVTTDRPLQQAVDYVNTSEFDYARGNFPGGYEQVDGIAAHTRAVLYVRNRFWVVVDRIQTDQPRHLQALWHYGPSCTVTDEEGTGVTTDPGKGNIRIVPVGKVLCKLELVKGQTEPFIQGRYSADYGSKDPSTTAIFSAEIGASTTFAWILVPAEGKVEKVRAQLLKEGDDGSAYG